MGMKSDKGENVEVRNENQLKSAVILTDASNRDCIVSTSASPCSRISKIEKFRLTNRDLEILSFLLDQKFASLEQIYFRFFDVRNSSKDPLPNGLHVTRQRLQILKRAKLISTEKVFSESKSLYLVTLFGFEVLQSKNPTDAYAKPQLTVDYRNYSHDSKVNDCRIALERAGKVTKWISERKIRLEGFKSEFAFEELPKQIVPDGVFVSDTGKRIAFEIECSARKKTRFTQKREAYESVMRGPKPLFSNVIWVYLTDQLKNPLQDVVGSDKRF
jgi:hypothetical protein